MFFPFPQDQYTGFTHIYLKYPLNVGTVNIPYIDPVCKYISWLGISSLLGIEKYVF